MHREIEVLRLVAAGRTNHAIAAQLFVSQKRCIVISATSSTSWASIPYGHSLYVSSTASWMSGSSDPGGSQEPSPLMAPQGHHELGGWLMSVWQFDVKRAWTVRTRTRYMPRAYRL